MRNSSALLDDVFGRNRAADGKFVYAVLSTGIYCKPSCPSRRPKPDNIRFFETTDTARKAGFRACKRCFPDGVNSGNPKVVELMNRVCSYIAEAEEEPGLAELSRQFSLSPYHLQRTFKKIVGVTPKQYSQSARLGKLKQQLRKHESITDAIFDAGFNSSSVVYSNSQLLGMKPSQYKSGGANTEVFYSTADTAFGVLLAAGTDRGICAVIIDDSEKAALQKLRDELPAAKLTLSDGELLQRALASIDSYMNGEDSQLDQLPLDVKATAFQRKVWDALRKIPSGTTVSYKQLAQNLQMPTASRAVARACATNPAALLIPCHRVIREDGGMGGYRWGLERKEKLLRMESGQD